MDPDIRHLSEEAFQGFLDGSLPDAEADRVREHVVSCARCRSELEGWEVLFHELGGLGELEPSPGFADGVMDALPAPEPATVPLAARIRGLFGLGRKAPAVTTADGHLTGSAAQDLLEGLLPRPQAVTAEEHLHACRLCRDEVDAWRTLMVRLDDVPRMAPSPGFSERVMAHVRVKSALAVARPTVRERLAAWLESISPRTRKGFAGLAGAAVTPMATLALVAYVVFSHPLVTVGNLLTFFWLEAQDVTGALLSTLLGGTVESGLLARGWDLVQTVGGSPGAAALLFALFSALTVAAVWVLYRNLIATHTVDERYAHVSF